MMDITDVHKVASRKKINADAEKLREKVYHGTKQIIKLKVAQDTAYWDLKERLHQLENNHERLQQNMVDVQMQHEAISGQYQEELRLRPETLNKLNGTRQICSVLEEYTERLKETLSRCTSDQAALAEAYHKSGQVVKSIKMQQLKDNQLQKLIVDSMQEKIKMLENHQKQLLDYFSANKQQLDSEVADLKIKLNTALVQKEDLVTAINESNRNLEVCRHDVDKKDEIIANLQNEVKQLLSEYNTQKAEMNKTIMQQEKDLEEAATTMASLKQALMNQEEFTKTLCNQRDQLQEDISNLENEHLTMDNMIRDMEASLKDASKQSDELSKTIAVQIEKKEELEKEIQEKDKRIKLIEEELANVKELLSVTETTKLHLLEQLNKTAEEANANNMKLVEVNNLCGELENKLARFQLIEEELATVKGLLTVTQADKSSLQDELVKKQEEANVIAMKLGELTTHYQELQEKLTLMERDYNEYKEQAEAKINDMTTAITDKDKELTSASVTVNRLISDVKEYSDARGKLERTLEKVRNELEMERENGKEKDQKILILNQKIEKLQKNIKGKEEDLNKNMLIIKETRNEKDRLQEKIQNMQNSIDNIQKELTGPMRSAIDAKEQPEQDDNAVPMPAKKTDAASAPKGRQSDFQVPQPDRRNIDSLFAIFSDSSMDGDTLDPVEVNRRFETLSRGGRLSPRPLASLKRRNAAPLPHHAGPKYRNKTPHQLQNEISQQSQAKNDTNKIKEPTFFKTKGRKFK